MFGRFGLGVSLMLLFSWKSLMGRRAGVYPLLVLLASLLLLPVAAGAQPPAQNKGLVRADAALSAVQKRVALVIGNKNYETAPLKNPVNDATDMATTLKGLGFEVILKTNVTNSQMDEALEAFAQKLGPNTIGLFYFSGHGIQVEGSNYLVPVGYKINRQADVKYQAFAAQHLLDVMGGSGCVCNIVILDACRNNPLPKGLRGTSDSGLGKMDAPSGTFIAYATAPGQTASDDPDKNNGLYTGVLLEKMKTPGLKIEDVFKATLVSVAKASSEKQVPWVESSLRNDFYFAAGVPSPVPVAPVVPGKGEVVETRARLAVTVTDAKTGAAIKDASVTVDGQSAPGGQFSVNLLGDKDKAVLITVTAPGYDGKLVNETLLRGKTVSLPLALDALVVPDPTPFPNPKPVSSPIARNVNPKDGAELVDIPAGPFVMGDDTLNGNKRHTVTLPAYSIYKNLVTVGMYEKFCTETGRKMPDAPSFNVGWSKKDHPIVNVSWNDAADYCNWAGTSLPAEAQWEKAARGTEGIKFPWGDTFDTSKLWCSKVEIGDASGTVRVGSFLSGASPYGVLDMAGNVWQWCRNSYAPGEYDKLLRGGSWYDVYAGYFRCADRGKSAPINKKHESFGFRCVVSANQPVSGLRHPRH